MWKYLRGKVIMGNNEDKEGDRILNQMSASLVILIATFGGLRVVWGLFVDSTNYVQYMIELIVYFILFFISIWLAFFKKG